MVKRSDNDNGPDPDPDPDRDPLDAVAPQPAEYSLVALTALGTTLNNVDATGVIGRSGLPMLLFKAREANGTYVIGQKKLIPEADSLWAVNPTTFQRGYICWGENNKKLGERMLTVSMPMPLVTELQDLGFPW